MGSDDIFKKRRKDRKKRTHDFKSPKANSFLIITEGESSLKHISNKKTALTTPWYYTVVRVIQKHPQPPSPMTGGTQYLSSKLYYSQTMTTSLPYFLLFSIVDSVPLCLPASITYKVSDNAAIMRLRLGKLYSLGAAPGGYSDTTHPVLTISSYNLSCSFG